MDRSSVLIALAAAVLFPTTSCGIPWLAQAPPAPAPPAPPAYEFPHDTVWTVHARITLRDSAAAIVVPRPFTALVVLRGDSAGIEVRCDVCPGAPAGVVRHEEVVYAPDAPVEAAYGSLARFALAVRDASARADLDALAPVMASDFTFALVGPPGPDRARAAWTAERFRLLHQVPALLDGGLSTDDGEIWVAPPQFADAIGYQGLRLGFRRSAGGAWEWIFLIHGQATSAER